MLIIGGTGRNGSLIIQEALSRTHTITALVRDFSATNLPQQHPNLTLIQGTPTSSADIVRALKHPQMPQVIITTLAQRRVSSSPFASPHPETTPDFMSASMRALLAAVDDSMNAPPNAIDASNLLLPPPPAQKKNPPKIIVNSTMGAGSSWAALNMPTKFIFRHSTMRIELADHNAVDALVRDSGLPFVLSRPCMLKDGLIAAEVKVFPDDGHGCAWMPSITRASVAKWFVEAAETSQWDGKAPVITN